MSPLELMLMGERPPSEILGGGYNGPPKPSDWSTALYATAFLVAFAAVTASGLLSRIWEYF